MRRELLDRLSNIDGPWPWLLMLPLYVMPWLWVPPGAEDLLAAFLALSCFIPLYFLGMSADGLRLVACAAGVLLLAASVAGFSGGWPVLVIYSAAMLARQRPMSHGMTMAAIAAVGGATMGLLAGGTLLEGAVTAFLAFMVGFATASRGALLDRNRQLEEAQSEVARLGALAERERLSGDLHDVLGRSLTLIAVRSDLARRLMSPDPEAAEREIKAIGDSARVALKQVRKVLIDASAPDLNYEISEAVRSLEAAGVKCSIQGLVHADDPINDALLAGVLREAITNVIRHANASKVEFGIKRENGCVTLSVADDGQGLDPDATEGLGLSAMRARIEQAGGRLDLSSAGEGTRLLARFRRPEL